MTNAKYGDICDDCYAKDFCDMALFGGHNPPNATCSKFKKRKQTNGDRIRAMTDEELMEWMMEHIDCGEGCPAFHTCNEEENCEDWLLQWLKMEGEE